MSARPMKHTSDTHPSCRDCKYNRKGSLKRGLYLEPQQWCYFWEDNNKQCDLIKE